MSDDSILDMIFNPGMDGVSFDQIEQERVNQEATPNQSTTQNTIQPTLLKQIRDLEARGILAAEQKDYDTAERLLTEAITLCPSYASAYNNRAQVLQLRVAALSNSANEPSSAVPSACSPSSSCSSSLSSSPSSSSSSVRTNLLNRALRDVDDSILLGVNDRSILKQSHTQRGLILKALGREEDALGAYRMGALLGNTFAKTESVRLNPYAALCNQYLQQALENHWSGLDKPETASNQ